MSKRPMTLIAVTNTKGGVGKTTTAVTLAKFILNQGYSVAFIDTDPQESSSKWIQSLELDIELHPISDSDEFEEKALELVDEYDCVIVDCPALSDEIQRIAIDLAEFIYIPVRPTSLDIDGVKTTLKKISIANKRRKRNKQVAIKASVFLTQVTINSRVLKEARQYFEETLSDIKLSPYAIPNTVRIADLYDNCQTVYDLKNKDLAELFDNLFMEVLI